MKKSHCVVAGFITYFAIQVAGIFMAYFSGSLERNTVSYSDIFVMMATYGLGIGVMGGLVGFLYVNYRKYIPINNIYLQGAVYHLIVLVLLSLLQGFRYYISYDFLISVLFTAIGGVFFVWCIQLFMRREKKGELTTS